MSAALLLAAILSAATPVSAVSAFGPNRRVNDDLGFWEQKNVVTVADPSGNVYVAWQDARNGDSDIYFASSADGGQTFTASQRLAPERSTGALQQRPEIALGPGGEIVVVWQDDKAEWMDFDIVATVSLDGGEAFAPAVVVSDGPPRSLQMSPSVAVDTMGNVYVAWQDHRSGNGDIRLARATLPSLAFGPSVRVDDDIGGKGTQSVPSVAVDSLGTVHVGYHDNRTGDANVYLATSADAGRTFGPNVRMDDTGTSNSAQGLVSLAVDSLGTVFAVWQDARKTPGCMPPNCDFDIYYAKSTDRGRTFSRPNVRVDDGLPNTDQGVPSVFVGAAGTVYVTWEDGRNVDSDIYFAYSVDGGTTFTSSIRVDDAPDSPTDPAYQYAPQVVESKTGLVFVAWHDGRLDDGDVYASTAAFQFGAALRVGVSADPLRIYPGESAVVSVRVTSNGTGVDGAAVSLTSDASGTFGTLAPLGGGLYRATFTPTAPVPTGSLNVTITARASKTGFLSGAGQALLRIRNEISVAGEAYWGTLAVGQSTDLWVTVRSRGVPLTDAAVAASATPAGGELTAWTGTTDATGTWATRFRATNATAGRVVTLTFTATKAGYLSNASSVAIVVLSQSRILEIALSSDRREMMSFETATIGVRLSYGGAGVERAIVSAFSLAGGNLSAAQELGGGEYVFRWDAPFVTSQVYMTLVVTAKAGGFSDARARITILVDPNKTNPSSPTQLFIIVEPGSASLRVGESALFTAYVYTIEGYVVSGARLSLTMLVPLGTFSPVEDRLNGVYTFWFTAGTVSKDTWLVVRIEATKYGYNRATTRIGIFLTP